MKRLIISFLSSLLFLLLAVPFALEAETPQALVASGHADEAVQSLQEQIRTAPTAENYNLLCRAYFELGAWDAGIPACQKAVSLAPGNSMYHLWLGRIYGEKADHTGFLSAAGLAKKVRIELERAVQLDPNNWQARTDLAEFYVEAPAVVGGGKDKARAQVESIARVNPAAADWVKARIAEKNNDTDAAQRDYRAAVEASHGGARAWLNLAGFYRRNNRFDDMQQALTKLESSSLDHPAALVDGAGMLLRTGRDFPLAIRLVQRYLNSGAEDEEVPAFKAHCLLGELLEKQGDRTAAALQYREALAMAHDFRPAQDGLRRVSS
jgi:tetratricopeptide (TPR) repeat protein